LADEFSERDDTIGYQLRVVNEIGGVAGGLAATGSMDYA
jgi:hypothetical protein